MGIYLDLIILLMKLGKVVSDDIFQKLFNDYNSLYNINLHNIVNDKLYLNISNIIEKPLDDLVVFVSDISQNNLFEWN
jgi:hypothetical protein